MARPAVFLDRDDTLNENATLPDEAFPGTWGDLYLPEFVRLLPGAAEACVRLAEAGYTLVVITNQGGVARGHATLEQIEATTARVCALIDAEAARPPGSPPIIAASYAAPHHPDAVAEHLRAHHPWRKPGPGMILAAARELGLDLDRSWMIGDKTRDVDAGIAAGVPRERCLRITEEPGDRHYATLADAAEIVLAPPPPAPSDGVTVTLRATRGRPLGKPSTRATVESAARALAERSGIALHAVRTDDQSVTVTLGTHRLAAMGFLAELRSATNRWHAAKHPGELLWPTGHVDTSHDDDDRDDWGRGWTPGDDRDPDR